jgi:DNA mismatch repair protein MSH5
MSSRFVLAGRVDSTCFNLYLADRFGSHPLQELTVPSYVSNDTLLVGGEGGDKGVAEQGGQEQNERPSMLVLTGPNYSGKSVYQKQVLQQS